MGWFDWLVAGAAAAAIPFTGGASSALIGPALGLGASAASRQFSGNRQGSGGGSGGGFFTGSEIQPNTMPFIAPWAAPAFSDWLFGGLKQESNGHWSMAPLPQYPEPLNPDLNNTLLPSVWNAWSPNNAGTDYLTGFLGGGGFKTPDDLTEMFSSVKKRGGVGGKPTKNMEETVLYGGTGPTAANMDAIRQWGSSSPAIANMMSNLAQFGTAGPGMMPLHSRAIGGPSAAANYLMPFLNPGGSRA